jgi:choline dehydrogenase-like flavoprotein
MSTRVDLVIVGMTAAGAAAAVDAARAGRRVLVVDRSTSRTRRRRLRLALTRAGGGLHRQVSVRLGVDVVCVAGARSVEAVVLRRVRSGRLIGVNTSNLLETTA